MMVLLLVLVRRGLMLLPASGQIVHHCNNIWWGCYWLPRNVAHMSRRNASRGRRLAPMLNWLIPQCLVLGPLVSVGRCLIEGSGCRGRRRCSSY